MQNKTSLPVTIKTRIGYDDIDDYENLGDLEVLSGVANYPTRIKCAMLGWHTLIAALKRDPNTVKTE